MTDLDARLRSALLDLAPQDPATDGLADAARRYATRARRAQRIGVAAAVVTALAISIVVAGSLDRPDRVVPAGPALLPADCTRQAPVTNVVAGDLPVPGGIRAAWLCPESSSSAGPSTCRRRSWPCSTRTSPAAGAASSPAMEHVPARAPGPTRSSG
jgi:hypothetical protein